MNKLFLLASALLLSGCVQAYPTQSVISEIDVSCEDGVVVVESVLTINGEVAEVAKEIPMDSEGNVIQCKVVKHSAFNKRFITI